MTDRHVTRRDLGPNRLRSWVSRSLAAAAFVGLAFGAGMTSAHAQPVEIFRFDDHDSVIVDDFCGDLQVRIDVHDRGVLVAREYGPDGLVRSTMNHHGGGTVTNLATGKSFSATWNYVDQEVRVTDNGDGTLTILSQIPGPERWYGPDGQVLYTDGGTIRLATSVNHAGTPSDPSDDTFISEEVVSAAGGRPQTFAFCSAFRTLTGVTQ